MLWLVALCVAGAWAQDPSDKSTFHNTHHLLWKDCGDNNAWLRLTNFDLTPSPIQIPGDSGLTFHGSNGDTAFDRNVALVVSVKKRLLSRWVDTPCTAPGENFTWQHMNIFEFLWLQGSCTHYDPCKLLQVYFPDGQCQQVFTEQGLPCTCPFIIPAHKEIYLNNWKVTFATPSSHFTWLTTGEYYVKMTMYQNGSSIARMCFEFYVNMAAHVSSGSMEHSITPTQHSVEPTEQSHSQRCPDDWVHFGESCYLFIDEIVPWTTAEAYCRILHAKMLEVESMQENNFVAAQIRARTGFHAVWQGVNDLVREGRWVFNSNGQPVTWFNWLPGHPDNSHAYENGQDCVKINADGTWDDHWCEFINGYQISPACEMATVQSIIG